MKEGYTMRANSQQGVWWLTGWETPVSPHLPHPAQGFLFAEDSGNRCPS